MKNLEMCLEHARVSQNRLSNAFRKMSRRHELDYDIHSGCKLFTEWSEEQEEKLKVFCERYGRAKYHNGTRVGEELCGWRRKGAYGLLRDLEDLLLLVHEGRIAWTVIGQAAKEMKDEEMKAVAEDCGVEAEREIDWICTHIKNAAPQAVTVPEGPQKWQQAGSAKICLLLGMALTGLFFVRGRRSMRTAAGV